MDSQDKRTERIVVQLTPTERALLDEFMRRLQGRFSLSELVRLATLKYIGVILGDRTPSDTPASTLVADLMQDLSWLNKAKDIEEQLAQLEPIA